MSPLPSAGGREMDNAPVVQAFGRTVSHDPAALTIALGKPTMRDLVGPDAVPNLPASFAGPARKASPRSPLQSGLREMENRRTGSGKRERTNGKVTERTMGERDCEVKGSIDWTVLHCCSGPCG